MLAEALKGRFQALPIDQFVKLWECIETINAALDKAGPAALLALNYVRAVHEEQLAQLLGMQQLRIDRLVESTVNQHENIATLATSRNEAFETIENLRTRLKAAKKTKRKA